MGFKGSLVVMFFFPSLLSGLEALEKLAGEQLTVRADKPSGSPNPLSYRVNLFAIICDFIWKLSVIIIVDFSLILSKHTLTR